MTLGAHHVGNAMIVFDRGEAYEFTLDTGERAEGEAAAGDGAVLSPMPGKVVAVHVKLNAKVKKGDALLVLEAMKMEHTLVAPFDGVVAELNAKRRRASERGIDAGEVGGRVAPLGPPASSRQATAKLTQPCASAREYAGWKPAVRGRRSPAYAASLCAAPLNSA